MITDQKIKQYQDIQVEVSEADSELKRINGFLARTVENEDNKRAIEKGHIFVKFAGTACYLPIGLFDAELMKRKAMVEARIAQLQVEKDSL